MIGFSNDIIKIYENIQDEVECGTDIYGKPHKCIKLKCIVNGDLQTVSASETRHSFGTHTNNTHQLYLNPDVEIKNTDIIKSDAYNGYFIVIGQPLVYNKVIPHIEVLLRHIPE